MNEKSRIEKEILEDIKKKKLAEVLGISDEEKKAKKKINPKYIKRFFLFFIFFSIVGLIFFLSDKYMEFQHYKEVNKEIIELGKKYKEEQKIKEEEEKRIAEELIAEQVKREQELKELKNNNFESLNTLSDEKKEVMFNLFPSGVPLKQEKPRITSPFGMRIHPVSGEFKFHHGVDFGLYVGEDVISTAVGRVSFAGVKKGYGYTVIVDHMYGFQTLYAHLDKIHVKVGEIVGKDKVIGSGGNSGLSTGPHLHYEVRYNGNPIDPKNFVDWNKEKFYIVFEKERSVPWEYFLTIMGKN